jgi:serine/threonine protein kinase
MNEPDATQDPLEALLAEILEQPHDRQRAALEDACARHAQHARTLRTRYEALANAGLASPPTETFPERLGDFRLLDRLGGGGMGVVFLAEQISLRRKVALKVIRPEHLFFEGARARFQREIDAVARLQHPGIVPVHTVGEDGQVPYFAMEHVHGKTLAEIITALKGRDPATLTGADLRDVLGARGDGPVEPLFAGSWTHAVFRLVHQVADALQHAHERGVVHRDVKPSNVIVETSGRARLLDFGIAGLGAQGSDGERLTRSGACIGSLPYLSPEQVRGESRPDDPRVDVYALGVTLYELLTLRLPFHGDSVEAVQRAIVLAQPAPLREFNTSVSWEAAIVCTTAMEQDANRRYASASAFGADVRNVLELRPITARRPSTALRARRWVERHPTWTVVLVAAFLSFVVGPTIAWTRIRRERDVAQREARIARGVSEFFVTALKSADPERVGNGTLTMREFLQRVREELPRFSTDVATRGALLHHMGEVTLNVGDPQGAIDLLTRAIDDGIAGGEDAISIMTTRLLLAQAHLALGNADAALPLADESIATFERELGPDHRHVAAGLPTRAGALFVAGKLGDAEAPLRRSIDILRAGLARSPADFAGTDETLYANLGMLALLLQYTSRVPEAEQVCTDIIEHGAAHVGELDLARIKNTVAMIRKQAGDLDTAERYYGEVLATYRSLGLERHPDMIAILNNAGRVKQERRDLDGARIAFEDALSIANETGSADAFTAIALELGLGRNALLANDAEAARVRLTALRERLRAQQTADPHLLSLCCEQLGDALLRQHQNAEARALLQEALDARLASERKDPQAQQRIEALLERAKGS